MARRVQCPKAPDSVLHLMPKKSTVFFSLYFSCSFFISASWFFRCESTRKVAPARLPRYSAIVCQAQDALVKRVNRLSDLWQNGLGMSSPESEPAGGPGAARRVPGQRRLPLHDRSGLGDRWRVALPGEIFVDLGLAIKQASPFRATLVLELSNCVETMYVPTRDVCAGGSYEVTNSALMPGSGEILVEAAVRLLREVASENVLKK
jgi:hypothetical protein